MTGRLGSVLAITLIAVGAACAPLPAPPRPPVDAGVDVRAVDAERDAPIDGSDASDAPRTPECSSSTMCDDGDFCNGPETCIEGWCVRGFPPACADRNTCTRDRCVSGRCVNTPDDSLCTAATNGRCDLATGCQYSSCTPSTCVAGPCETAACEGTTCVRRSTCSGTDTCCAGACVATGCDDGNACTDDVCGATGCVHQPNSAPCSDGDFCTFGDRCVGGACVAGPQLACDDGNVCTRDSCDSRTGCQNTPAGGGTSVGCGDGDACNGAETCQESVCTAGRPMNCDDGNACTRDSCAGGACAHVPDDSSCTAIAGGRCDATAGCQYPSCDPGTCIATNDCEVARCVGTMCMRSSRCLSTEVCCAGACVAPSCDDGNACTIDSCGPSGCVHAPASGACSDGDGCTVGDVCASGSCTPGIRLTCNDNNPCTTDVCMPSGGLFGGPGCRHDPLDGTSCADSNLCNGSETCSRGTCTAGTALSCDDGVACTIDGCASNACTHTPDDARCPSMGGAAGRCDRLMGCQYPTCTAANCVPLSNCENAACNGPVCLRTNRCTSAEMCCAGRCAPLGCDDGNVCTRDACDALGCTNLPTPGATCTDPDLCTANDRCMGPTCRGDVVSCAEDSNPCTGAFCAPGVGCGQANVANGTPCDDGNACNGADACVSGVCTGGSTDLCGSPPPPVGTTPATTLGVYHWNIDRTANTTGRDMLDWGAELVRALGTSIIRIAITPVDPYGLGNPSPYSLVAVASQPSYRAVFAHPSFSTIIITAYSSLGQASGWADGLSPSEAATEKAEVQALAEFLLMNFPGKNFIISDWESDNGLRFTAASGPARFDAYVAFTNARAEGVAAARAARPSTSRVYSNLELLLARPTGSDAFCTPSDDCALTRVAPFVTTDLYSLSAWASTGVAYDDSVLASRITEDLTHIYDTIHAARSSITRSHIFVGELGMVREGFGECGAATRFIIAFDAVRAWGVPFSVQWQVLDNAANGGEISFGFGAHTFYGARTKLWNALRSYFTTGTATVPPGPCPLITLGGIRLADGETALRVGAAIEVYGHFPNGPHTLFFRGQMNPGIEVMAGSPDWYETTTQLNVRIPAGVPLGGLVLYARDASGVESNGHFLTIVP